MPVGIGDTVGTTVPGHIPITLDTGLTTTLTATGDTMERIILAMEQVRAMDRVPTTIPVKEGLPHQQSEEAWLSRLEEVGYLLVMNMVAEPALPLLPEPVRVLVPRELRMQPPDLLVRQERESPVRQARPGKGSHHVLLVQRQPVPLQPPGPLQRPVPDLHKPEPVLPVQRRPVLPVQRRPVLPVQRQPVLPVQRQPVLPVQRQRVLLVQRQRALLELPVRGRDKGKMSPPVADLQLLLIPGLLQVTVQPTTGGQERSNPAVQAVDLSAQLPDRPIQGPAQALPTTGLPAHQDPGLQADQ